MSLVRYLRLAPNIEAALDAGRPVVALESTIISHGMPWPRNYETAKAVEAAIRDGGAEPATIAVVDGLIKVGLEDSELEVLARSDAVMKLSRADLAFALATKRLGATTVAATMICAALAGIRVFATGGIGGVHKGGENSMDVSADLEELSRTPVAVVCAGAKAILDLPRTLEVLETNGVPVVAYGTDELPAFWSRKSGLKAPLRLDDPRAVAAFLRTHFDLGLAGVLLANPVPAPAEIPADEMAAFIAEAIATADAEGVGGKAVTPFLLRHIGDATSGRSLDTNIALVLSNARLGAAVAKALSN
jgi:pseudouridine-5'-phosphate glycosidase